MKLRPRFETMIACAVALIVGSSTHAAAHPHGWIEIETKLVFDDAGNITAMHHNWLQDEFNSAYNLEGTDKDGDGVPDADEMELLAKDFMTNLANYDYFSRIEHGKEAVKITKGTDAELSLDGFKLRLTFTTPFAKPVSPREAPVKYAVYDPTFYIEMLHIEGDKPVILTNRPDNCAWELVPPEPNPDLAAYALALGPDENGGTSLGEHFAEWVTITCK